MIKSNSYEAPDLKVYLLHPEGTLCQSVDGVTIRGLEYDDEDVLDC